MGGGLGEDFDGEVECRVQTHLALFVLLLELGHGSTRVVTNARSFPTAVVA